MVDHLAVPSRQVAPGSSVEVSALIGNSGDKPSGVFTARYFLSDGLDFDPAVALPVGGEFSLASIAAGGELPDQRTIVLPTMGVVPGRRFLLLVLDPANLVIETGETDNAGGLLLSVEPAPDALESNNTAGTATSVTLMDGVYARTGLSLPTGDEDWFQVRFESNLGVGDLARVKFDPAEGDLQVALFDETGARLGEGGSEAGSMTLSLAGLPAGEYWIAVRGGDASAFSSSYSLEITGPQVAMTPVMVAAAAVLPVGGVVARVEQTRSFNSSVTDRRRVLTGAHLATVNVSGVGVRLASAATADGETILNGHFDLADSSQTDFGWTTRGAVGVASGRGVLAENGRAQARLSQTFAVPPGARALRFTLQSVVLGADTLNPPDAFEVALLNHRTLQPLVASAAGLTESDALFNVQANGVLQAGAKVTVTGSRTAAGGLDFTKPVVVTVDLQGMTAGTEATLYFDLIGFGAADSRVAIDNVEVLNGPPLEFALDAATDSGRKADDVTRFDQVLLVGQTEPGQRVFLDQDGDDSNDVSTVADDAGKFEFVGVRFQDGENTLRVRATNPQGTTEVSRVIELDRAAPMVLGRSINHGEIQRSMVVAVAIQFDSDVSGSLTAGSLVLRNLTTGTSVPATATRMTYDAKTNTVTWIFPDLTGGSLSDGNYGAVLGAAGVTDIAGNLLDGNGDGVGADDYRFDFFRYYGDVDGDRDVDFADQYWFQKTYQKSEGSPLFDSRLDHNGDGVVNGVDLQFYRLNAQTVLAPPPLPRDPGPPTVALLRRIFGG